MSLELGQETALNLTLNGSTGSFKIGAGKEKAGSIEVKYLLTHVSLNFATASNDALLSELAPVREIFDFQSLDFDEIMQRDIDDSRVSHELVPYLLDEHSREVVKLFPPIVVVVLPLQPGTKRPAPRYPKVSEVEVPAEPGKQQGRYTLCSGDIGEEAFQFEQPIYQGKRLEHDLVKLRLNTHRCALVIVDGQHRAMALLALYRNLKDDWSDARRAPFREYYAEWTSNYIQQFELASVSLPLMICTMPALDETYKGDFDMLKAARSIFYTLNKNARKVSESRNRLLDDNDLISTFLRRTLSDVKQKDLRGGYSFRIANVELDQHGDKVKLQSPMALTGVTHLYYIIEHMMLNSGDVNGCFPRSGKFYKRNDLEVYGCFGRLNALDKLGQQMGATTKRDSFISKAADILSAEFFDRFGRYIVNAFERFAPWETHNQAAIRLKAELEKHKDRQLQPILFEGQGIGRVFESHREKLAEKLDSNRFSTDVPQIKAVKDALDATAVRLNESVNRFSQSRAEIYLSEVSDKQKLRGDKETIHEFAVSWLDNFYDNVLNTIAFQTALICGFFHEVEKADLEHRKAGESLCDREAMFSEYIARLNEFFIPKSSAQLKRLIKVFGGDVSGASAADWKIAPSKSTFRNVVYRGEMQPDQWPKYKYFFTELWRSSDAVLDAVLDAERLICRRQIFLSLHQFYKGEYCKEQLKLEEKLSDTERRRIEKQAFEAFVGLLKNMDCADLPSLENLNKEAISAFSNEEMGNSNGENGTDGAIFVNVTP